MRELDELLTRYLDFQYLAAGTDVQAAFEHFLSLADPEILALLTQHRINDDPLLGDIVERILGAAGGAD